MNALQRLIRTWVEEHPGTGGYTGIARRGGLKPGTVQAIASTNRPRERQLVKPEQIEGLARGMGIDVAIVQEAASRAAGVVSVEEIDSDDDDLQVIMATTKRLTPDRRREILRRVQFLLAEQSESGRPTRRRR